MTLATAAASAMTGTCARVAHRIMLWCAAMGTPRVLCRAPRAAPSVFVVGAALVAVVALGALPRDAIAYQTPPTPAGTPAQPQPHARDSVPEGARVEIVYAVGADLSFLKSAEERGVQFKDNGVVRPGLEIFRDHGYDWIRLRLFHTPTRLPNNLEYTIALAREAKARGFRFLLDYHYADHWADPQQQWAPAAWDTVNIDVLADSVFAYTRNTIIAFREAGVMPDMVQIGNEVRNGMIWPLGRLPEHWDNFARLFKAGLDGIDAGRGRAPRPYIMLHYDEGGDARGSKAFFDRFHSYGVPYDIIGLSYYPWWHGSLLDLRNTVLSLLEQYPDKDVIVVEVGYRPREYDATELPPYPVDAPGGPHKAFLEAVNDVLLGISNRRVKGIFWWEPASGCGRDYFDEQCNALPVITVFDRYKRY